MKLKMSLFLSVVMVISLAGFYMVSANSMEVDSEDSYKSVIVELNDPPALKKVGAQSVSTMQIKSLEASIQKTHEKVLQQASSKKINYKKGHDYTLTFNGFQLKVKESQIDELSSLPKVKSVYEDREYTVNLNNSTPVIGAPDVWSTPNESSDETTGKGINIAVIDTGVDYTHPDLGGSFGEGSKVVGGYDFVNDDPDPMDDHGHGTHVAGIAAANGEIRGVAPDANILAYKVLNQFGSGTTSDIIAAIDDAIDPSNEHRADVINMSLGGGIAGEDDPLSKAATNAVESGVLVVVSAGNNGPGYGTITAPGGAEGVLTVGASITGVQVPKMEMVSPEVENLQVTRMPYSANPPEEQVQAELIDIGMGQPEDYKGIDASGKILLMQATFPGMDIERAMYAEEQGALAVIFHRYNPFGDPLGMNSFNERKDEPGQHQFMVGANFNGRLNELVAVEANESSVKTLLSQLSNGPVELTVEGVSATDEVPEFSSRGTIANFKMTPDLLAPGVEILSTFPESIVESGYYRMSGTSMAAPHGAGAAALMKQLHPDWGPELIFDALVGSANRLEGYDPLTQGAGRLDVAAAAESDVTASPRTISFGLADLSDRNIEDRANFSLTNHGTESVEIDFTTRNVGHEAEVYVEPSSASIDPGEQMEFEVTISSERTEASANIMGWVKAEVTGEHPDLQIPFFSAIRPLQVHTSPDPAKDDTEVFVYSADDLAGAPEVTVTSSGGETQTVTATHDHGRWWRAPVNVKNDGVYNITVEATTQPSDFNDQVQLKGFSSFESTTVEKGNNGASEWQSVGPNAIGGPISLNSQNNKMAASSFNGAGFFLSDVKIGQWQEMRSFPVAGGSTVEVIYDPIDQNRLYAAVNGGLQDPTYVGKLLVSYDGGLTWTSLPFPNIKIEDIMINHSGEMLIVESNHKLYISRDRGKNWQQLNGNWERIYDTNLFNNKLIVGTSDGVYAADQLTEGPVTFEKVFEASGPLPWMRYVESNDQIWLAVSYFGGLYGSTDEGETWNLLFEPSDTISMLKIENGNIFVGTYSGIWKSDDLGMTWEDWNDPIPETVENGVTQSFKNSNSTFVSVPNAGIFMTNDKGQSYSRIGLPGATVYDLTLSGDHIIAGTQFNTYRKKLPKRENIDRSTLEWGMSGHEGYVGNIVLLTETSPENSDVVYKVRMGAQSTFYIYKSLDGGQTWELKASESERPNAMLIHPANPEKIYISYWSLKGSGILKSNDGGQSWEKIEMDREVTALAGDPNNPNRFWTGGTDGLYVTNDGGETFEKLQDTPTNSIDVNPENPDHLVFGARELYYSLDGGVTVEEGDYKNLEILVKDLMFSKGNPDLVYAATGSFMEGGLLKGGRGVLKSTDGGRTWTNFSQGLNNKNTTSLVMTNDHKHLYVGTVGGSVYRIKLNKGNGK